MSDKEAGRSERPLDPSSGRGARPCIRQFREGSETTLRLVLHSPWNHLNVSASGNRFVQTPEASIISVQRKTAREVLSKTNHVRAKPVLRQSIPYLVLDAVPVVGTSERQAAAWAHLTSSTPDDTLATLEEADAPHGRNELRMLQSALMLGSLRLRQSLENYEEGGGACEIEY